MQVLQAIETRVRRDHKAELAFVNVYAFARGSGMTKRDATDNATRSTRSTVISYERRRELLAIVERELQLARIAVQ